MNIESIFYKIVLNVLGVLGKVLVRLKKTTRKKTGTKF